MSGSADRGLRPIGVALAAMLVAWGCGILSEPDRSLIPPLAGSGSGGEAGAGVGGDAECNAPSDCPGQDGDCQSRRCAAGVCGITFSAAAEECDDGGGQVCDGDGRCVACVSDEQCGDGECDDATHTCKPPQCENRVLDGDETDVDCGGPTCPNACELSQQCVFYTDCISHYCNNGFCASCFIDNDCQLPDYCDRNQCVPKQAIGASCTGAAQCQSLHCVDGVCCSGTCAGRCQSCALGGSEGICDFYPAGVDPDGDCKGDDVCEGGSGSCECGNGNLATAEDCDDGDNDAYDGCSALCDFETTHLIISEFVITPTGGEYIEIYNPTSVAIDLSDVYLSNVTAYFTLSQGVPTVGSGEFLLQFPVASIAAGGFVTVSLESATAFQNVYGVPPSYDLDPGDGGAPAMLGSYDGSSQLASIDLVVLFRWDGASDLVTDLDYLNIGLSSKGANKTGVTVGASTYLPDTPIANQSATPIHQSGFSIIRCDTGESTETKTSGNGSSGHDETSEDVFFAFKGSSPTPNAPPASGVCP